MYIYIYAYIPAGSPSILPNATNATTAIIIYCDINILNIYEPCSFDTLLCFSARFSIYNTYCNIKFIITTNTVAAYVSASASE